MNKAQAGMVLLKIKAGFPFFDLNDDAKALWIEKLMKADETTVLENLDWWIENESRTPVIADIIKPAYKMTLSEYERLEGEKRMLELQEYHETENVMPMPEWLKKKFEQRYGADFGGEDE